MSGVKRKRESSKSSTAEIRVTSLTEEPVAVVGSFFNGMSIPRDAQFDVYQHKKNNAFALHGESATLEYNGVTALDDENDYIVAIYDAVHKSVELYKTPVINGGVRAKAKRVYKGPAIKLAGLRNIEQRNALGEAFGTKKAKAAITNLERNRVDADKLKDVELDIVDTLNDATADLPTRQEMDTAMSHDRPTPACNVDATRVEDVYRVFDIIPKKEWAFLRTQGITEEHDEKKRLEFMPYGKSSYVTKHLNQVLASKNTEKLQLLMYASLLFGVYENRRVRDKQSLMEALDNNVSEVLIDGILQRFAVARAGQFGKSKDRSFVIDPSHEDKLLCYLLALIMHIDNFMIELPPLAHELNMKPARLVGLCKALGATIKSATVAQAEAFGIPKANASTYKVATLKVPFKLPEMARRGRKAR
ncbi:DNA-directed RNA polymerase I subunit rpa49 [Scheffersomyces spartinae]|uniref:DNA-directed RNA polymerase I subunit rpa49 n=1 Tax=Scheffersomyces spartinae TaxID=45513 RepID=A0A9P7VDS4_9ASCO|nr:DNA-directed RNA polymerase I subunit rpa49 [Scheffersomyces spartinae]KAG7196116.1 DNA-directed RNA polymerase I subunit rpa49 [Scheffersomyces spartinae]